MKGNQLKAGVILSYASMILTNAISIIYTPIMLRMLGQSEYGLYQLAHSVVSYLGLLNFGFGSAYIKFYSAYKKDNDMRGIAKLNGIFMMCFLAMSLLALVFGSILVLNVENIFGRSLTPDEIVKTRNLMIIMVFNLAIMFPNSVFNANITAHERYFFQRVVSLISSVLNPMLVLILLFCGIKSMGLAVATTVVSVLKLSLDMYYCKRKLHIKFIFKEPEFKLLKRVWVFSFFIFLNLVTDMLNYSVDKFVLGMVKGTVNVAVYSVGASFQQYYVNFSSAISTVFIPRVNRLVAEGESDRDITELFTKIGRVQFIVISLVMSGFILFGKEFIRIWAGDGYDNAYYVALLIMLPSTIPFIQSISIEIQRAKNMHKFRSIVFVCIAVANLIISIPLAKLYGEVGSALGTAIATTIGNIIIMNTYNHVKVKLDMVYFWKSLLRMAIPVVAVTIGAYFILARLDLQTYVSLLCAIIAYTLVFAIVMWNLSFNDYEKDLFKGILRKLHIYRR